MRSAGRVGCAEGPSASTMGGLTASRARALYGRRSPRLQSPGGWSLDSGRDLLSPVCVFHLDPYARFSGRCPRASFRIPHLILHPAGAAARYSTQHDKSRCISISISQHRGVADCTATNGIRHLVGQHASLSPVLASHQGLTAASTALSPTPLPYNPPTGTGRICR